MTRLRTLFARFWGWWTRADTKRGGGWDGYDHDADE